MNFTKAFSITYNYHTDKMLSLFGFYVFHNGHIPEVLLYVMLFNLELNFNDRVPSVSKMYICVDYWNLLSCTTEQLSL